MIALPSGRLAGITSIRARYHALRLNQVVLPETPSHELCRLVDIVMPPAAHQWLPGSHTYIFSGHTLDELLGLSGWSQEDRMVFAQWIQQETQQREIEQVRRRLVSDELPLVAREYAYPQRLYSALRCHIERLSLRRASPQQWRQTLFNLRQQGVREEELVWSGLLKFLEWQAQEDRELIERRALLSAIDFSAIRLCLSNEHALQHVGLPVVYTHCSRYEHKTLFGGSDYREWLLSLPDYPLSYFNSHYYERNLLLHFRTKIRTDLQGRRLLFIEEIQSDWHQSGAVQGYQNRWPGKLPPAPFSHGWIGLALKLILLHGAEEGLDGVAWARGEVQESLNLRPLASVRRRYDKEIPRCLERLCRPWQVNLETTCIETKEPSLNISRHQDKWLVTDAQGRFSTQPKSSQREAMLIMARHCRRIELEVPMLPLSQRLREGILQQGFPLFGESLVLNLKNQLTAPFW